MEVENRSWVGLKTIQDAEVTRVCADWYREWGSEDAWDPAGLELNSCCPPKLTVPRAADPSEWISILAQSKLH